jgi:hypothetical protein
LLAGLAVRYLAGARRASTVLLGCVPLVDVLLLAVSIIDLRRGGAATPGHGLAAIYIGVSVMFGPQMIRWADQRFAHRFAGGPRPVGPPASGRAHAARERRQWLRHMLAYILAGGILGLFTLLIGDPNRTAPLWFPMAPWGIVLVIDFVISFSYTIAPRK